MDFSHQIHGGKSFTQLAPSNVSAAVKLRPVPAREFQANSSIRKQAEQAPNFDEKKRWGFSRWVPFFFQKKHTKHQKNTVVFFLDVCIHFFSWSDASNVNIYRYDMYYGLTGLQMELRKSETLFGIADSDPCRIEALDSPPPSTPRDRRNLMV